MEYSGNVVVDTEVVVFPHLDIVLVLSKVSSALPGSGFRFNDAADVAALHHFPLVSLQW